MVSDFKNMCLYLYCNKLHTTIKPKAHKVIIKGSFKKCVTKNTLVCCSVIYLWFIDIISFGVCRVEILYFFIFHLGWYDIGYLSWMLALMPGSSSTIWTCTKFWKLKVDLSQIFLTEYVSQNDQNWEGPRELSDLTKKS